LIAVNGMPINRVSQLLGTTFAHANDQWLHAQVSQRLTSFFMLEGLDIIPAGSTTVPLTFQSRGGQQFNTPIGKSGAAQVSGLLGPTPDYLQNPSSYYWPTKWTIVAKSKP
jgi:hypothetical protein